MGISDSASDAEQGRPLASQVTAQTGGGSDPPQPSVAKPDQVEAPFQMGPVIGGRATAKVMQDGTVLCPDWQKGKCQAKGTCPKGAHRGCQEDESLWLPWAWSQ